MLTWVNDSYDLILGLRWGSYVCGVDQSGLGAWLFNRDSPVLLGWLIELTFWVLLLCLFRSIVGDVVDYDVLVCDIERFNLIVLNQLRNQLNQNNVYRKIYELLYSMLAMRANNLNLIIFYTLYYLGLQCHSKLSKCKWSGVNQGRQHVLCYAFESISIKSNLWQDCRKEHCLRSKISPLLKSNNDLSPEICDIWARKASSGNPA